MKLLSQISDNKDVVNKTYVDSNYQTKIDSSHTISSDLINDSTATNKFVSTSDKTTWNAKYSLPANGIPSTDLDSNVQASLSKADTALQSETYTGTITSVKMNGSTVASSGEADLGTVITSHQDISGKQNITDNTLATANKKIPNAINEVNSIAKGANRAISYSNYSTMVSAFNNIPTNSYNVGQNIMIVTLEVPDLWISSIESTSSTYTYTTDAAIVSALQTNGYIQVGYYKLSALETQKVDLSDYVQTSALIDLVYPVGSIYMSANSTSPATLFGGTWTAIGQGRTLIGAGTGTDSNSTSKSFTAGNTGGEYTHKLTTSEMPSHTHNFTTGGRAIVVYSTETLVNEANGFTNGTTGWWNSTKKNVSTISSTGEDNSHNIIQPYLVVYMWQRTA